jgi:hypothetical protein
LTIQGEFFVNNLLDVKEIMLFIIFFAYIAFFGLGEFGLLAYGSCFISGTLV